MKKMKPNPIKKLDVSGKSLNQIRNLLMTKGVLIRSTKDGWEIADGYITRYYKTRKDCLFNAVEMTNKELEFLASKMEEDEEKYDSAAARHEYRKKRAAEISIEDGSSKIN